MENSSKNTTKSIPPNQQSPGKKSYSLSISALPLMVTLVMIVILAVFIRQSLEPIAPSLADTPLTQFSAERAKEMLSEVLTDERPHPLDSPEIRLTEARIVEILRRLGYQEEIQDTAICHDYQSWGVRCARVRNIIVSIDGTTNQQSPDARNGILISSHYDSVDTAPGASDAGVAVAAMLETARLLSLEEKPKNRIVLLFNEGEEYGLLGARAFMQQHPLANSLKVAINVEARGSKGQSVMFETGENSGWLVKEYIASTPKPLSSSLFYEVYKILPNDTDLTVFKKHDLQGLNFAHAEKLVHYHTPLDNLANLELGTIQHHGDNLWGVLKNIKDRDFSTISAGENNLVYTDVMGLFVVHWAESNTLILVVALLILFVFSIQRLINYSTNVQPILSKRSIRLGVYSFFALLILLPLAAFFIQKFVVYLSPTSSPWLVNNFPMQLTLWSALTTLGISVSRFAVRRAEPLSVLIGTGICWIILSTTSSYFVVGISYLFILPSALLTLGLLSLPQLLKTSKKIAVNMLLVIHAVGIAVIFLPIVYTLEIMVSYQMSAAIGLMFSFVMIGVLPMLAIRQTIKRPTKRIQLSLLITALLGTVWTLQQPSFSIDSPQSINLYHLQNFDSKAHIVAGADRSKPMLSQTLSKEFERNNGSYQSTSIIPWSSMSRFNTPTQYNGYSNAKVEKTSSTDDKENIKINLQIESYDDALREVVLYVSDDDNVLSVSLFGNTYHLQDRIASSMGYHEFRCIGLQCRNFNIVANKRNNAPVEALVVKSLKGLPAADARFAENRGVTASQIRYGDRTLVVSKIEL